MFARTGEKGKKFSAELYWKVAMMALFLQNMQVEIFMFLTPDNELAFILFPLYVTTSF